MHPKPLRLFIIKIIILLPACYWLWYYSANFSSWIAADLSADLLIANIPDLIAGIELQGKSFDVITHLSLTTQSANMDKTAEIFFSINPLNYNFGLPLCTAMILASPGKFWIKLRNFLISLPILLTVQIWGVYFSALKQLYFDLSAYIPAQASLSQLQLDSIAISYQLGTLILPTVIPLIIWFALYKDFIASIAPALYKAQA